MMGCKICVPLASHKLRHRVHPPIADCATECSSNARICRTRPPYVPTTYCNLDVCEISSE